MYRDQIEILNNMDTVAVQVKEGCGFVMISRCGKRVRRDGLRQKFTKENQVILVFVEMETNGSRKRFNTAQNGKLIREELREDEQSNSMVIIAGRISTR